MLQPHKLSKTKLKYESKLSLTDIVFLFVFAVFSIALISIFYLIVKVGVVICGFIALLLMIFLLWLMQKKIYDSHRRYYYLFQNLQFLTIKKTYNKNELSNFEAPIKSISNLGVIKTNEANSLIFKLNGFDPFKLNTDEYDLFIKKINNLYSLLTNNGRKVQIVKISTKNDLKENLYSLDKAYSKNQNITVEKDNYFNSVANDIHFFGSEDSMISQYYFLISQTSNFSQEEINEISGLIESMYPTLTKRIVEKEEILNIFRELFKLNLKIEEDKITQDINGIIVKKDLVKLNEIYLNSFFIDRFPVSLNDGCFENLLRNPNLNFIISFTKLPSSSAIKTIDKARRFIKANQIDVSSFTKNVLIETELAAIDNFIEEFSNEIPIFEVNFQGLIHSDSEEKHNLINKNVRTELENNKMVGNFYQTTQIRLLNEFWMNENKIKVDNNHTMTGLNLAKLWSFTDVLYNDKNHFLLGHDYFVGHPLFFNDTLKNKQRPSSSMFMIGKTGSGKTASISKILNYHSMNNDKIYIIDPNNDYGSLFRKIKHNNVNMIDLTDINYFQQNILEIKDTFSLSNIDETIEKVSNNSLIKWKIDYLKQMFLIIDTSLTERQLNLLGLLIQKTYEKNGFYTKELNDCKQITFDDVIELTKKINSKQIISEINDREIFSQKEIDESLLFLITNFSRKNGTYKFFNTDKVFEENSNNSKIYNFQRLLTKSQKDNLIAMFLLIQEINNEIQQNLIYNIKHFGYERQNEWRNIVIVIDEIHKFLGGTGNTYLINFLFDTIKTLRKFWGLMIMGTQSFKDFVLVEEMKNKTIQLLEQTQYKFIYKVDRSDITSFNDTLSETSKLLDFEKNFIQESSVGQCLFMIDDKTKVPISLYYNDYEQKIIFKTQLN